jgi:hypothetical protein
MKAFIEIICRNLFGTADTSASQLEKMVAYVRREMSALDAVPDLVMHGKVSWGPPPK